MQRFYWLIEGQLAGCSRPSGTRGETADLDADLARLRDRRIGAVLSLTEEPLPQDTLDRYGIEALHLPVPDMHALLPDELLIALEFIDRQQRADRAVAVHCLMGQGRTGCVLAAYRIRQGSSAEEAIEEVRRLCPGAIESSPQLRALGAFAAERHWLL